MTEPSQLTEQQQNVSIKSQDHLRRWAQREAPWVVFRGVDLVDALPFPDGHQMLQHLVSAYRSQRIMIPDEEQPVREWTDPIDQGRLEVPGHKHDLLTVDELAELALWIGQKADQAATTRLMAEMDLARKQGRASDAGAIQAAITKAGYDAKQVLESATKLQADLLHLHELLVTTARSLDHTGERQPSR